LVLYSSDHNRLATNSPEAVKTSVGS